MNYNYYGKRVKYAKIFEEYNGSKYQLGPEDFLLGNYCILGACECNSDNCLRLNNDVQCSELNTKVPILDDFLPMAAN